MTVWSYPRRLVGRWFALDGGETASVEVKELVDLVFGFSGAGGGEASGGGGGAEDAGAAGDELEEVEGDVFRAAEAGWVAWIHWC